jgi:splicing factor 3A subunit 3
LEERAKRLFATKNKSVEDLNPALFMKDANKMKRGKWDEPISFRRTDRFDVIRLSFSKDLGRYKEIAGVEAQIYRLVELLSEQRAATLENVRRKQAKAGEDNEDDEDADGGEISDDDSDHEADGMIYNPKNLPLGWDGKVRHEPFRRQLT